MKNPTKNPIIYQAKDGALELRGDFDAQTVWASQKQIAEIFGVDRTVVTRHINNIFKDQELDKKVVSAKFALTTQHGAIKGKMQTKNTNFYNLDIILAVGYRTKSSIAIEFRKWSTKILKQYITKGYALNKKLLEKNKAEFLQAVEDIKKLSSGNTQVKTDDILELVKAFSHTWFSLQSYDEEGLPKDGFTKKDISITADELYTDIAILKKNLMDKSEATELFAQEKTKKSLEGILGNVFQSVFGQDAYATVEEKAAHLLYFVIKNHPFTDGNKRTGAFSFVWFLQKTDINFSASISPETLTTLTLLIAESNPKDKEQMIGLVLLLLKK